MQQLREELGAKQAAVARVEKEVAPVLREVQQAEAEVRAATMPYVKHSCRHIWLVLIEAILGRL